MAKAPQTSERPKALDTLVSVTEIALAYRYQDRTPTLSDMARVVSTASRLLRFKDLDEKIETENQCVLVIAKKRELIH